VTATQEPITPQPEPTMASILQENEFLKFELEAYKQDLAMAKEAYEKELNLYTLAHTATMSEGTTTENPCREYMCCQCGDIYYQAGYKVIQIPIPRAPPAPSTFTVKQEKPVVTQEPVGPSKIKTEPWPATNIKFETPAYVNKVVQTLPIDEYAPPSQINIHTFVEQATQTLPQSTTCNAETQTQTLPQPITRNVETKTHPWDEQAIIEKWKKEFVVTQAKSLQEHKQIWINHTYSNWEALEKTRQEARTFKKQNKEIKGRMLLIFDLAQNLLAARKPSYNYSLFLMERLTWFQIKSITEGRPHAVLQLANFVKTFAEASAMDQHLLCEAYFHNEAIPENDILTLTLLSVTSRSGHSPPSSTIRLYGRMTS
jgi:hypothetical protein